MGIIYNMRGEEGVRTGGHQWSFTLFPTRTSGPSVNVTSAQGKKLSCTDEAKQT